MFVRLLRKRSIPLAKRRSSPGWRQGARLMADNATSRQSDLKSMLDAAWVDPRVDALVVAIGTADLICRKD
jgi:hypothetical protein